MRNLISSPFHSIRAFISYVLIFVAPIWALVSFLGSVDFVMSYAEPIVGVLHSWWGVIALIIAGFVLLAWDSYRRQSESTTSLNLVVGTLGEGAARHPVLPEADSEEVEKFRTRLREVEQEHDALQKEYEELIVDYDALKQDNERLASLFVGEQQLKQEAHNLSEGLFGFAKTRKGRSDTIRRSLDAAVKRSETEEVVERIAQEKTQYDTETDHLYQQHYEPRIRALLSAVERRGWCDAGERKEIEDIFNDSTITPDERIRRGAARIGAFGRRIL